MPQTTRPAAGPKPRRTTLLLVAIAHELEAHSEALARIEDALTALAARLAGLNRGPQ